MKKMGRPKIKYPAKKIFTIKLNPIEEVMLDYLAKETGLRKGSLIKQLIREQFRGKIKAELLQAVRDKLGENISEEEIFK